MRHYGDITKLIGADLPTVDCVTGGSPCQDLSVAGKRAGLAGERSGLFMEQIRIVKEMREHDRNIGRSDWFIRPRYMVWENVPGAFSSNGGKDFQAVLTEITKIVSKNAPDVPLPKDGKWTKSGCLMGFGDDGIPFSIAWRLHDAQFWGPTQYVDGRMWVRGTPQRRKRIALVADFRGTTAPEILFERSRLQGSHKSCRTEKKDVARSIKESSDPTICLQGNGIDRADTAGCNGSGWRRGVGYTLNTIDRHAVVSFQERAGKPGGGKGILIQNEKTGALSTSNNQFVYDGNKHLPETERESTSAVSEPAMIEMTSTKNTIIEDGICPTLTSRMGTGGNQVNAVCMDVGFMTAEEEMSGTLLARQYKDPPIVHREANFAGYKTIDSAAGTLKASGGCLGGGSENLVTQDVIGALCSRDFKGIGSQDTDQMVLQKVTGPLMASGYQKNGTQEAMNDMYVADSTVRRLTPTECERLQGYPDGWTNIGNWKDTKGKRRKTTDGARYKALGNSICIPFWFWLLKRISAQYERMATLGSLFDGIGGFPYCWERCNGKGSAVWASEIEEFPIAVTKKRFPEGEENNG